MTQYIDKADADAIKRKVEREVYALADAAVKATAQKVFGVTDETEVRAALDGMVRELIAEIDRLETQATADFDALAMEVPGSQETRT